MTPLAIAIVGMNQGAEHLAAALVTPEVRVAALCDCNEALLEERCRDFGLGSDVVRATSIEAAASLPSVDALVVALPHHLHAEAIEAALRHRKHLLKEKPLARTLAEAHGFSRRMRAAGLLLRTGVQRRRHPTYRFLREQIGRRRILSAYLRIAIPHDRLVGWRASFESAGGGVLIDLGYHGIDLMQFLLGPLQPVSCLGWDEAGPAPSGNVERCSSVWAVTGTTWACLRFEAGAPKQEVCVIETDEGEYTADRERVTRTGRDGSVEILHTAPGAWDSALEDQLRGFARDVRGGAAPPEDLSEQIPTLRFVEACYAQRGVEGLEARETP